MNQFARKMMMMGICFAIIVLMSACSRSAATTEGPPATPIDLAPQQTLTALSISQDDEEGDILPENTDTATNVPPQATDTVAPQASETPSVATETPEKIVPTEESSTGDAFIVTQTVTPVSVPLPGSSDAQWMIDYLDDAPDIDGDFGDWPGVVYAMDKIVFGPEFFANQVDLSAEFKIGWDDQFLFLGVLVRDSQFVQTATEGMIFQGDSIEVLLDADWEGDRNSDKLSDDDYQLGFSPGNLGDIPVPIAYLWAPTDREGPMQLSQVKGRLTEDGYMVEIAIAWEEVGVNPTPGMTLGFLLSVSDNDSIGKNEQQSVISFSEPRLLTNPSTWVPVVLAAP